MTGMRKLEKERWTGARILCASDDLGGRARRSRMFQLMHHAPNVSKGLERATIVLLYGSHVRDVKG